MENPPLHDLRPEQYAAVIRDLIAHEDDVTNHRSMWWLIIQGLLVNAYFVARQNAHAANALSVVGILVTLSAFVMLYQSYRARNYFHFLGTDPKLGKLNPFIL